MCVQGYNVKGIFYCGSQSKKFEKYIKGIWSGCRFQHKRIRMTETVTRVQVDYLWQIICKFTGIWEAFLIEIIVKVMIGFLSETTEAY